MCDQPNKLNQWEEHHSGNVVQVYDFTTDRYIAPKRLESPIKMERWTYNLGSNMFIRYLTFQNGELIKIETGEKGSD